MITWFLLGAFSTLMLVFGVRGMMICATRNRSYDEMAKHNKEQWDQVADYWQRHLEQADEIINLMRLIRKDWGK